MHGTARNTPTRCSSVGHRLVTAHTQPHMYVTAKLAKPDLSRAGSCKFRRAVHQCYQQAVRVSPRHRQQRMQFMVSHAIHVALPHPMLQVLCRQCSRHVPCTGVNRTDGRIRTSSLWRPHCSSAVPRQTHHDCQLRQAATEQRV